MKAEYIIFHSQHHLALKDSLDTQMRFQHNINCNRWTGGPFRLLGSERLASLRAGAREVVKLRQWMMFRTMMAMQKRRHWGQAGYSFIVLSMAREYW